MKSDKQKDGPSTKLTNLKLMEMANLYRLHGVQAVKPAFNHEDAWK